MRVYKFLVESTRLVNLKVCDFVSLLYDNLDRGSGLLCHTPLEVDGHVYNSSVCVGVCKLNYREFQEMITKLRPQWPSSDYHLIKRNCLDFSKFFTEELGADMEKFPKHITRLPSAAKAPLKVFDKTTEAAKNFGLAVGDFLKKSNEAAQNGNFLKNLLPDFVAQSKRDNLDPTLEARKKEILHHQQSKRSNSRSNTVQHSIRPQTTPTPISATSRDYDNLRTATSQVGYSSSRSQEDLQFEISDAILLKRHHHNDLVQRLPLISSTNIGSSNLQVKQNGLYINISNTKKVSDDTLGTSPISRRAHSETPMNRVSLVCVGELSPSEVNSPLLGFRLDLSDHPTSPPAAEMTAPNGYNFDVDDAEPGFYVDSMYEEAEEEADLVFVAQTEETFSGKCNATVSVSPNRNSPPPPSLWKNNSLSSQALPNEKRKRRVLPSESRGPRIEHGTSMHDDPESPACQEFDSLMSLIQQLYSSKSNSIESEENMASALSSLSMQDIRPSQSLFTNINNSKNNNFNNNSTQNGVVDHLRGISMRSAGVSEGESAVSQHQGKPFFNGGIYSIPAVSRGCPPCYQATSQQASNVANPDSSARVLQRNISSAFSKKNSLSTAQMDNTSENETIFSTTNKNSDGMNNKKSDSHQQAVINGSSTSVSSINDCCIPTTTTRSPDSTRRASPIETGVHNHMSPSLTSNLHVIPSSSSINLSPVISSSSHNSFSVNVPAKNAPLLPNTAVNNNIRSTITEASSPVGPPRSHPYGVPIKPSNVSTLEMGNFNKQQKQNEVVVASNSAATTSFIPLTKPSQQQQQQQHKHTTPLLNNGNNKTVNPSPRIPPPPPSTNENEKAYYVCPSAPPEVKTFESVQHSLHK